jgi:hypothetical protein
MSLPPRGGGGGGVIEPHPGITKPSKNSRQYVLNPKKGITLYKQEQKLSPTVLKELINLFTFNDGAQLTQHMRWPQGRNTTPT